MALTSEGYSNCMSRCERLIDSLIFVVETACILSNRMDKASWSWMPVASFQLMLGYSLLFCLFN